MNKNKKAEINRSSWSALLYALSCIWVFPASNFILPLIVWLMTKHKSLDIEEHGKNLLNFQLSWFLIGLIIWAIVCFLSCSGYFSCIFGTVATHVLVAGIIGAFVYCFIIAGAISAYQGSLLEFPLSYRFIK